MEYYTYCFIRKDLPQAQQIIQLAHANYEAGKLDIEKHFPNIVLFEVANQDELLNAFTYIRRNGINCTMFFETLDNMQYTAICTRPISKTEERALFKDYKLYK